MGERRIVSGSGMWIMRLFGLPFAAMGGWGVWCLLTGYARVTVNHHPGTPADAWIPGIFGMIGLVFIGLRWRRVIDGDRRTIETSAGWMLWTRTTATDLGAWQRVEVRPSVTRGSGKNRRTAIPVVIVGERGELEIEAPATTEAAQRLADRIAVAAGLVEQDALHRTVATAEPLLARLTPADLEAPEPDRNRIRVTDLGTGCRFRVPPSGALGCLALQILLFAGIGTAIVVRSGSRMFLWVLAAPVLAGVVGALRNGSFGYDIEVDARDGLRARGRRFAPEALRRLDQQEGGLYAGTADDGLMIASGLTNDEVLWLRARILRALRG
jgi:hypothetical protein